MKQKMVIKAQMIDDKGRAKAMKIAVGIPGVISVSIEGKEKDQMSITGEGVDVVKLTRLIRKKMGYAELFSVSVMEEKKEQKKEEKKTPSSSQMVVLPTPWTYPVQEHQVIRYEDPTCSIM